MGQKSHPYGLRLGYIKTWKARWFARGKQLISFLHEDLKLRQFLKKKLGYAGISAIEVERSSGRVRVRIHTARPGVIIGRRGQEIDQVKEDLADLVPDKELFIDIKEIREPQLDAQLVAENIALQLEKRVSFRRVMKKTVQNARAKGTLGIKIQCKGRLGGAEIARAEGYHEGKIPLSTFRADIDYGVATAFTTYGTIGVKAWIYKGDVLVKKEEAREMQERKVLTTPAESKEKEEPVSVPASESAPEEKPAPPVSPE